MKPSHLFLTALAILLLAGCSTPDSRIGKNQARFDAWPPEVRQKVRAGQADIGFTPDQVRVALGEPDRTYTRTSAQGVTEVWAYRDRSPTFSFGIGLGSFGRSSAVGGGVGMTTGGDRDGDRLRVIFADGKVVAIERSGPR